MEVSQITKLVNDNFALLSNDPGEQVSSTSSKFRFQSTRGILTYKTHLPKEAFIRWFKSLVGVGVDFIRLAHENGDEEVPYEHTHVVFKLSGRKQTTNERFFDYSGIHPHIKCLKNEKALEDAKHYISKEDPENADLAKGVQMTLVQRVQQHKTLKDALSELVHDPSDAIGIKCIYEATKGGPQLSRYNYQPDRPWQISLMDMVNELPDPRTILWVYDFEGNSGKTALAKHLYISDPSKWFISKDMGTSRDASTTIQNALENGWTAHGIIIDLPRQAENHERMYSYIEEIKDGFVTSQKYSGRTMAFDNPHVVVFANWKPKVECLSKDRWDIRFIKDGYLIKDTSQLERFAAPGDFVDDTDGTMPLEDLLSK